MIKAIHLENFKLFKEKTEFPLSNITLLTGINGRGKSSFLQSMLLFKQTFDKILPKEHKILLNGECVNLGTFDDIMNSTVSKRRFINIEFFTDDKTYSYKLSEDYKDDMVAKVSGNLGNVKFLRNTHFIAADRVGPQQFYLKNSLPSFLTVGIKGEFVGNVLYQKREEIINEVLYLGEDKSEELLIQTGEWLGKILDAKGLKVTVKELGNGVINLSFQFGNSDKEYKPSNVGFGYTFILPIVLSGLIAKQGEILIVENPEAHLHPKAQSNLIEFLARVSKCGVQVFIESHSEHILNALRVLVAKEKPLLKADDVSILFLNDDKHKKVTSIEIESDGSITYWPKDFFDQTKQDLQKILRF